MNIKIWRTIAFLLDHSSKNVKSDEMWYGRSFYLLNSLIADSYDGSDLSMDSIIAFVKKNKNSTNIINYLNSLPGCPTDIFNFSNEGVPYDAFLQNHGYLVMIISQLTICVTSMADTSNGAQFFDTYNIGYSKEKLIVSKNNVSLFFSIDSGPNILFSHFLEDGVQNDLNVIFNTKEIFINYLKDCDTIPLDKDIIKMIYC